MAGAIAKNGVENCCCPELSETFMSKEKPKLRFDRKQYNLLRSCSETNNRKKWSDWRIKNRDTDILLDGADLEVMNLDGLDLTGASFRQARFVNASCRKTCFSSACLVNADFTNALLEGAVLSKANMEEAHLGNANLSGANIMDANLVNAKFGGANLSNACLMRADLKNCHLVRVILSGANLKQADMERAFLKDIHLRSCCFERACLEDAHFGNADLYNADFFMATLVKASFQDSNLEGTSFRNSDIRSASFNNCKINSKTKFIKCLIDKKTNLYETNISMAYCDPSTKQLLSYNLRKRNWDSWCRSHPYTGWFTKLFRWVSDYGLSSKRIAAIFILLACVFAVVYFVWVILFPPGIIANLANDEVGNLIPIHIVSLRALYFSVVTMTTLGFGDMYALPNSITGHVLLMLQVILGYVLLGALITRFAILFSGDGPAGSHMINYVKGKCFRPFFDKE